MEKLEYARKISILQVFLSFIITFDNYLKADLFECLGQLCTDCPSVPSIIRINHCGMSLLIPNSLAGGFYDSLDSFLF